jgi:hypothetical protein
MPDTDLAYFVIKVTNNPTIVKQLKTIPLKNPDRCLNRLKIKILVNGRQVTDFRDSAKKTSSYFISYSVTLIR